MATKLKIKDMTTEQLRVYKREHYQRNKEKIQAARLAKHLESGTRKVKSTTLEKYKFQVNDLGQVVIPINAKVVYTKANVATQPEQPIVNVIVQPEPVIQSYNPSNTACTGKELKDWVATVLVRLTKRAGSDDTRSMKEIKEYMKVPDILFKLYGKQYKENEDFSPLIKHTDQFIQNINKQSWASGTKSKFLGRVLFLSKNFSPLQNRLTNTIYDTLNKQWREYKNSEKAGQRLKTQSTPIFSFDVIKQQVTKAYGKVSYQTLLISLYNEIIGRDDFGVLMAYKPSDITDNKKNYLLLDRTNKHATVYLNSYKTAGTYGSAAYPLSKDVVDIILKLHPTNDAKYLFPLEPNKLGEFLISFLRKIPLFKNEPNLGIKYIRHSIISTKLLKLDKNAPDYAEKVTEIANKSFHSVERQETYLSPLKNASGKLLYSAKDIHDTEAELNAVEEEVNEPGTEKYDPKLIGVKVKKRFGNKYYLGIVTSWDPPYYRVVYPADGEVEDYTASEIRKLREKK